MNAADLYQQAIQYTADGLRDYSYVTRNDLSCREIRDATVTKRIYHPDRSYVGSVYDGRGDLVRSALRFNTGDIFPVDTARLDDISAVTAQRSDHPTVFYGGILFPILGHFYFESVARLWPLLWRGQGGAQTLPVYFHHWPGLDIRQFMTNPLYRQTLLAFGIEEGDIHIVDEPEQFDTLILADPASAYHLNLDQRMAGVLDRVAESILGQTSRPGAGRRVYLSRSRWADNRRIINEEAIDVLMAERGLEVIHTETLSPSELMAMLKAADLVVSTDGSHAHLAAFCRPNIRTVMLDTRPVPTQFAISALRGFRSVHVPLFQTALYRMEQGITDPATLGQVVDLALA